MGIDPNLSFVEGPGRLESCTDEASFLKLDCSKLKATFLWRPLWNVTQCMDRLVEWYDCYLNGKDLEECMNRQIKEAVFRKEK